MRLKIKICGITREEDALQAVVCGADAIGFVLYPASARYVPPERAAAIRGCLPPFVTTVAVLVDPDRSWVERVVDTVGVDLLQFQGDEPASFCESVGRRYIKAVRVRDQRPIGLSTSHPSAQAWLLDTYAAGQHGGTGKTFDWSHWPGDIGRPLILAGGLTPSNVAAAIAITRPYGVDVSGGVEGVAPGTKDATKIRQFIDEARNAADKI